MEMMKTVQIITIIGLFHTIYGQNAEMSMILQQTGFHRTLKYTLGITSQSEACDFFLEQTIPSSVYVSTDQLDALQRLDKINYYTNAIVDVEALTSNSKSFKIYLYGNTELGLSSIQLPIHFRYHLPGNTSFIRVSIAKPKLFVNCPGKDEWATQSGVQFKCSNGIKICDWWPMNYEMLSSNPNVSIPIGYKDFRGIVTFVTILVSWVACYYVLSAIVMKSKILKRRL